MRVATWNIYWLGDREGNHIVRQQADETLIAQVISALSPDVLALQEIVDPGVLERILAAAAGAEREYTVRAENGQWLTSDRNPMKESNSYQKVFLAIDRRTIEFVRGAAVQGGPGGRRPFAADLRHRQSGQLFTVVAVHLRSGYPDFLDQGDAARRHQEASALARWLRGEAAAENPDFPQPGSDVVVVLGDFNAELDDPNRSLDPLMEGSLEDWWWDAPEADAGQAATAIDDGYTIDFVMLSPVAANWLEAAPGIFAYDQMATFGGPTFFHAGPGGKGPMKSYGVSDHRPVFADVAM